jgi:DNA polymerase IV
MAMRKRSLKTSFEITGPDALFHMMSIRFRSDTIYSIAPNIETFSIDECFIDLKPCLSLYKSVAIIASKIKQAIHEATQGIRCTIGISEGELTAKYCGSTHKGGITIIPPNQIKDFIANAPIEKICGIGKSKTLFLKQHGIHHCKDVTPNTYHLGGLN